MGKGVRVRVRVKERSGRIRDPHLSLQKPSPFTQRSSPSQGRAVITTS